MSMKNLVPFVFAALIGTAISLAIFSRVPALWRVIVKSGV